MSANCLRTSFPYPFSGHGQVTKQGPRRLRKGSPGARDRVPNRGCPCGGSWSSCRCWGGSRIPDCLGLLGRWFIGAVRSGL